ncbi:MAG: ATP-binding cassette domain-containing protein [Lautropia sp.]|nr:MAG: ATP-binding cassette domain-containing protein [Pseudomonadota bacterium]MBC6958159.1 ATP-binding cassette domain-containing protein [Lautropia sp.]MDL1906812.1 ATP-binding cassette domain-containing protein [Betaproteobacteria bacterium PRO1]RIK90708.1 MAG: hypothetical protein DCC70_02960 [Burkholderiales bacterium]
MHRLAVEVEGLGYRHEGAQQPVFSGFSTIVEAGDKVAIVGASGAGKTTLLRCLAGAAPAGPAPTRGCCSRATRCASRCAAPCTGTLSTCAPRSRGREGTRVTPTG